MTPLRTRATIGYHDAAFLSVFKEQGQATLRDLWKVITPFHWNPDEQRPNMEGVTRREADQVLTDAVDLYTAAAICAKRPHLEREENGKSLDSKVAELKIERQAEFLWNYDPPKTKDDRRLRGEGMTQFCQDLHQMIGWAATLLFAPLSGSTITTLLTTVKPFRPISFSDRADNVDQLILHNLQTQINEAETIGPVTADIIESNTEQVVASHTLVSAFIWMPTSH